VNGSQYEEQTADVIEGILLRVNRRVNDILKSLPADFTETERRLGAAERAIVATRQNLRETTESMEKATEAISETQEDLLELANNALVRINGDKKSGYYFNTQSKILKGSGTERLLWIPIEPYRSYTIHFDAECNFKRVAYAKNEFAEGVALYEFKYYENTQAGEYDLTLFPNVADYKYLAVYYLANKTEPSKDLCVPYVKQITFAENNTTAHFSNIPSVLSTKYGKLLANVEESIVINADASAWTDTPTGNGGAFINQRYSDNYNIQRFINVGTGKCFERIVHAKNHTVYRNWTETALLNTVNELLDKKVGFIRLLSAADDLNNITTNGLYYFSDANKPINSPFEYGNVMFVFGSNETSTQKVQLCVGYGSDKKQKMAYRTLASNVWHRWEYVVSDSSPYYGKYVSFYGDSISTYIGYVPTGDGYATYYTGTNCGVSSVDETWWMRLINETGMKLCANVSISGSCCSTGARQDRVSGCKQERIDKLAKSDGTKPDVIIVYLGTNDYLSAVGKGTFDGSGSFPSGDPATFREAYSVMISRIQQTYPMAEIHCCTLQHTASKSTDFRPVDYNENNEMKKDWNEVIRELANLFHCHIIDFEKCGINASNIPFYTGDDAVDEDGVSGEGSTGRGLHPNAEGHRLMFMEALKSFK
ncbi:MAG: GDSL-type esterase/lipase family protein, partial [Lachnospiraceae bacterium]|nr:GDSL-type esterase/lipase family protein [Lachnospiraceae bacterium]